MRPFVACALTLALTACGGSAKPPTSTPPDDMYAMNLLLQPDAANAVRIGFQATGPSADVIVDFEPTSAHIRVCALPSAHAPLPPIDSCTQVSSGVRETIQAFGSLGGIGVVERAGSIVHANVFAEFDEAGRALELSLPGVPTGGAVCQDQGCNPTFELTPIHNGSFTARASWNGGDGALVLLQGSVRGRSASATGIPYREAARQQGASPQSITAEMSAPGEYALVIRQEPGGGGLRNVRLDATWP